MVAAVMGEGQGVAVGTGDGRKQVIRITVLGAVAVAVPQFQWFALAVEQDRSVARFMQGVA